ncbi:MAG: hypothetical protein AB9M60_09700 [Leptothrix sp. (in: b-proteobacteria)]
MAVPLGAPSYSGSTAVQPGWLATTYAVGQVITADFGTPINGATSYSYAFYRNGVAIPGASGTTASRQQTYVAVAADSGAIISCRVGPINSLASGATVSFGGIYVQ